MPTLITNSAAETEGLGERWGREARSGWVFALCGELGSGKTQLVKGLARGLGSVARVHSPTFTLLNRYGGGRLTLFHLDLYRIETAEQFVAAGLEEFLQTDGVTVIEWADRLDEFGIRDATAGTAWPGGLWRKVTIEVLGPTQRRIRYEDSGD